jgi:cysteine desulfurase / selenocysteine lyase
VPLDVRALEIDYLAAGAHKWLMGLDGAGVLYVRAECLPQLRPAISGCMSHVDALDMLLAGPGHLRYDRPLRTDAKVFEGGMLSSVGCAALDASVGLILELGVSEIFRHVNAYNDLLEKQLLARGFRSLRASDVARRSCTLSFEPPTTWPATRLASVLGQRGVVCSCPDGVLRFSPHWHNSHDEVAQIVSVLDDVIADLVTS